VFKKFIPKDDYYFTQLDLITEKIVEGVRILDEMLDHTDAYGEYAQRLKTVEHEGDEIVHALLARLHKTFITPLDRDDIHMLVCGLDDILDTAEGAGARINMFRPRHVPVEAKDLVKVLLESVRLIQEMIGLLRNLKQPQRILSLTVEIGRLEDQADHIRRSTLARLFREEEDVRELIKWKDILQYIERSTDRCDDVGNVTEGIVLEHT
jgi:predicted phosphate transport protein (TIGR00153 family)